MGVVMTWAQVCFLWTRRKEISDLIAEFSALGSGHDDAKAREKVAAVLHETQRQIDRATERSGN